MKKKKKRNKKKKRKSADDDTGSDSSDAFSDSDSDSDSDGSSDASSASERVLTVDEMHQQFRRARQAASRAADEYNELLHRLVGLIAYVRRKQVELPHFQMLPETPESILNFVERRSRDVARWELFIDEWKGEFIGK